jgi:hypothetical protein
MRYAQELHTRAARCSHLSPSLVACDGETFSEELVTSFEDGGAVLVLLTQDLLASGNPRSIWKGALEAVGRTGCWLWVACLDDARPPELLRKRNCWEVAISGHTRAAEAWWCSFGLMRDPQELVVRGSGAWTDLQDRLWTDLVDAATVVTLRAEQGIDAQRFAADAAGQFEGVRWLSGGWANGPWKDVDFLNCRRRVLWVLDGWREDWPDAPPGLSVLQIPARDLPASDNADASPWDPSWVPLGMDRRLADSPHITPIDIDNRWGRWNANTRSRFRRAHADMMLAELRQREDAPRFSVYDLRRAVEELALEEWDIASRLARRAVQHLKQVAMDREAVRVCDVVAHAARAHGDDKEREWAECEKGWLLSDGGWSRRLAAGGQTGSLF